MDVINLFLKKSSFKEHFNLYELKYNEYYDTIFMLFKKNLKITSGNLSKILVIALHTKNNEFAKFLLESKKYGLYEILLACEILDSQRMIKQINKKLNNLLVLKKKQNVKEAKINILKTELDRMYFISENYNFSLSSSKIKFLKKNWINNILSNDLEFYALSYPKKKWKKLINLLHTSSKDFNNDWFCEYIIKGNTVLPEDSLINICSGINKNNYYDIVSKYKIDYRYLRKKFKKENIKMNNITKHEIIKYTPINQILWYYKEFEDPISNFLIVDKINNGEKIDLPYGKLVEQLMNLKEKNNESNNYLYNNIINFAENKLEKYDIKLEPLVVVLGDASASMQIAVKTSSIIASILCVICSAEFRLFRDRDELIQDLPYNIDKAIDIGLNCKAFNSTCPVASLFPYYQQKKIVKTFFIITDEEENCIIEIDNNEIKNTLWINYNYKKNDINNNMYDFAKLFKLYRNQVFKSKIVFITFTKSNNNHFMINRLKEEIHDIENDLLNFILDPYKPDLTKLDNILESLSIYTNSEKKINYNTIKNEIIVI